MSTDAHAIRHSAKELVNALHINFGTNIANLSQDVIAFLENVDLNSRIISAIRTSLSSNFCTIDSHQRICAEILDEVFADFSLAMYLCSIGLIVPARMSIRRAFEMGLAAVYMWDMPHEYWGWRQRDQDLSFSAMVAHLNSVGFIEYLMQLKSTSSEIIICDQAKFQKIYRELSNTVHGKNIGLPSLSPERFAIDKNGLLQQLKLVLEAQQAIIGLLVKRFAGLEKLILDDFPQFKRS